MEESCEINRLKNMIEQAHCELNKLRENTYKLVEDRRRYRDLLEIVRDAGCSHVGCKCSICEAHRLVMGELEK